MASTWAVFNSYVRIGPSSGGFILPVTDLFIRPIPWTGSGSTIIELFDGRRKIEQPTWGYEVDLRWGELGSDSTTLRSAIIYLLQNATNGVDFFPVHQTGTTFDETKFIPDMIPNLSDQDLAVQFDLRARKKGGSVSLVSKSFGDAVPLSWLND